ncbi:type IV secretion system protein [Halomonas sp. 3A7M]|uniref:type IV secretion system protein n=1 Tax=Halomonas sp. 3A7M TaxID=2742616 RepID=UPI0018680C0D|nr:type IV secretion system protein [Halomonas sp. 3A7M]
MKAPRLIVAVVACLAVSGPAHAQIPTIDVDAIFRMGEQLVELEKQLQEQQEMVRNMTEGLSGMGDQFFRDLEGAMPENWGGAMGPSGKYGAPGREILEDRNSSLESMTPSEASEHIAQRQREHEAANLAMLQEIYDNNNRELREMQDLAARIQTADTQREVQDLQARIQTSQGAIEANSMRLNNLSMLSKAETEILERESYESFHRRATGDEGESSQLRLVR